MSKITPGPWVYRPHEFDDWGVVKAGNFTICQARDPRNMTYDITNRHREKGTDPWEANARAIAALPDLIEALEAFMETYKVDREIQEPTHVRDCWMLARSALLKAKGEAGQ